MLTLVVVIILLLLLSISICISMLNQLLILLTKCIHCWQLSITFHSPYLCSSRHTDGSSLVFDGISFLHFPASVLPMRRRMQSVHLRFRTRQATAALLHLVNQRQVQALQCLETWCMVPSLCLCLSEYIWFFFFMINAFYHADVDLLLFLTCVDRGSCYEWCLPMERWWSILQLPPSPSRSAVRATATTMACSHRS